MEVKVTNARLLLILITCCYSALALNNPELSTSSQHSGADGSARSRFTLPKLFQFDRFKRLFHKSYLSGVDELNRERLYLARAFQVFLSAFSYKNGRSSSYLAINEMSDWSPFELHQTFMSDNEVEKAMVTEEMFLFKADQTTISEQVVNETPVELSDISPEESPIDDGLSNIQEKLSDIEIQRDSEEEGLRALAKQLDSCELTNRRKRDAHLDEQREISINDLVKIPRADNELSMEFVNSNNPDYKEPQSVADKTVGESTARPIGTNLFGATVQVLSNIISPYKYKAPANAHSLPDEVFVDHRDSGCVLPARNQGRCGSCYAFAVIAYYEWAYCDATMRPVAFSEQYLVDCGARASAALNGCRSGLYFKAAKFVARYGLELQRHYPYQSRQDTCPYDSNTPAASMGYLRVRDKGFEMVALGSLDSELTKSPLVMSIRVNRQFLFYGGGVDQPANCNRLHAVLLVGHGRQDGLEYWLIKNSHGTAWGEQGYYKLSKAAHKCIFPKLAARLRDFSVPSEFQFHEPSRQVLEHQRLKKQLNEAGELNAR